MCVCAYRSADFADPDALTCLGKPLDGAPEFVVHQRQLQPERDRLGVHAVTAADHRRHFEPTSLLRDHRSQRTQIVQKKLTRLIQLHR